MGYYINVSGKTHQRWLDENAVREISPSMVETQMGEGNIAVCLVDNGFFTAAAVVYSPKELEEFTRFDGRPKSWFEVPREKLIEVGAIDNNVKQCPYRDTNSGSRAGENKEMVDKNKMKSNLEEIWDNVHFKLRTAGLTEKYAELLAYIGEDDQCSHKDEGEEVKGCFVCCMDEDETGGVYYDCLLDIDEKCPYAKGEFIDKKNCPYWRME